MLHALRLNVVSLEAAREYRSALLRQGLQRWQLELLLSAFDVGGPCTLPRGCQDLPPVRKKQRASFTAAIAAAAPAERARALQDLDDEVLARTTVGPTGEDFARNRKWSHSLWMRKISER